MSQGPKYAEILRVRRKWNTWWATGEKLPLIDDLLPQLCFKPSVSCRARSPLHFDTKNFPKKLSQKRYFALSPPPLLSESFLPNGPNPKGKTTCKHVFFFLKSVKSIYYSNLYNYYVKKMTFVWKNRTNWAYNILRTTVPIETDSRSIPEDRTTCFVVVLWPRGVSS